MWYLFQGAIMFAVGSSNIVWNWTPNGYVVGLAGILAAGFSTVLASRFLDALSSVYGRYQARQKAH